MTTVATLPPMDRWETLPWQRLERSVFKLQTRIYHASRRGDTRSVRTLQRLLLHSRAAKLLAVRRVTQDNRGKKTAGVDGVKALPPIQRLQLADILRLNQRPQPVRRVWIDKPGSSEQRPLGIPVMADRARQRLVQLALEPQWEGRFEPNSYGFRPGRSCHDAIRAIYNAVRPQAKYVLDADIEKCFARICHEELLTKVHTSPTLRRQLKAWLKAGVLDHGEWFPTPAGTIQGAPISPLLANVALHGLETVIITRFPRQGTFLPPQVIRYGDDFAVLHRDRQVIEQCETIVTEWLRPMGLQLKPSKTRIAHTLKAENGEPGFDFLGFHIRQYPVGRTRSERDSRGRRLGFKTLTKPSRTAILRHQRALQAIITRHQQAAQSRLIRALNPVIEGWARYYSSAASKDVFGTLDSRLFAMLWRWAKRRHPTKGKRWVATRYWRIERGKGWTFQSSPTSPPVSQHARIPIRRHIKVKGQCSPYDGDWVYWSTRLGRHPEVAPRIARLLKTQDGKCRHCGLFFANEDLMEVDHIVPKQSGGTEVHCNLQLLHRHCHDQKTACDQAARGTHDKRHVIEEPCEGPTLMHGSEAERRG
jgi:RNA-directed DNA polymerase